MPSLRFMPILIGQKFGFAEAWWEAYSGGREAFLFDVSIHTDKVVKNLIHILFVCTLFLTAQEAQALLVGSGIAQRIVQVESASERSAESDLEKGFEEVFELGQVSIVYEQFSIFWIPLCNKEAKKQGGKILLLKFRDTCLR